MGRLQSTAGDAAVGLDAAADVPTISGDDGDAVAMPGGIVLAVRSDVATSGPDGVAVCVPFVVFQAT
jgi:hypothetical protein